MAATGIRWDAVLPVKPHDSAKSRLLPVDDDRRDQLVAAFGTDVIRALSRSGRVARVAVVGRSWPLPHDPEVEVVWIDEPTRFRSGDAGALNSALASSVSSLRRDQSRPIVLVTADLPSLRSREVSAILDRAAGVDRAFVADAAGSGTTMLLVGRTAEPVPSFGPESARRHRESHALDLSCAAGPGARLDVDVAADLHAALAIGVGSATARVLASAMRA